MIANRVFWLFGSIQRQLPGLAALHGQWVLSIGRGRNRAQLTLFWDSIHTKRRLVVER